MADKDLEIAVLGLGAIGGALAKNLIEAGYKVAGYDPSPEAMKRFMERGGVARASAGEAVKLAEICMTSLPSPGSLRSILDEAQAAIGDDRKPRILTEMSTLAFSDKDASRAFAEPLGITLLDCAVSGNGSMALNRDLVVLASGDQAAIDRALPLLEAVSRKVMQLGAFGTSTKFKLIMNLLVTIHGLAAAEALTLGAKVGLDRQELLDLLKGTAASSGVLEARGPIMVSGDYSSPTAAVGLVAKDLGLIDELARSVSCPTPLFSASTLFYRAAVAQGMGPLETSCICQVLEGMAGIDRTQAA